MAVAVTIITEKDTRYRVQYVKTIPDAEKVLEKCIENLDNYRKAIKENFQFSIESNFVAKNYPEMYLNGKKFEKKVSPLANSSIDWKTHSQYASLNNCCVCEADLINPISVYMGIGSVCGGFAHTKEYRKASRLMQKGEEGKAEIQRLLDELDIDWNVMQEKLSKKYYNFNIAETTIELLHETKGAVLLNILEKEVWIPKYAVIYVAQTDSLFVNKKFVDNKKPLLKRLLKLHKLFFS